MIFLAKSKKRVIPLSEIAKRESLSFDYLEKIMARLEKEKLVKSKKGIQGGYFLAKKTEKIKMKDIFKVLEGNRKLVKCLFQFCPREKDCSAKIVWQKLDKAINKTLKEITLNDLI